MLYGYCFEDFAHLTTANLAPCLKLIQSEKLMTYAHTTTYMNKYGIPPIIKEYDVIQIVPVLRFRGIILA